MSYSRVSLLCLNWISYVDFMQEVHDLLSDYELKYCFVDKYKGTGE